MPGWFTIVLYYIVLLSLLTGWLFRGDYRRWKISGVCLLVTIWCTQFFWQRPATRLTVLPLNGGHAVFAESPGRHGDWLIDCGATNSADATVKPFLRAQGVNRLSHFVVTHGESHFSGGAQLIDELFQPRNIYTGASRFRSSTYREFLSSNENDAALRPPLHSGDRAGPWTVLYPGPEDHHSRAEDDALALRTEYGGTLVLLLSDLGHAGQNALLNRATNTNALRADIVVAGVPPEGEPLTDFLLDAIQPKVIIIADSEYPAQRRATDSLKQRLARRNVPVLFTRDTDAVTITLTSHHWRIHSMDGTSIEGTASVER